MSDSVEEVIADRDFLAVALSSHIRFGTSTWTYEGWQGQVYKRDYKKTTFARECLGQYCQYLYNGEPLFRTVGNDSTFYRPPTCMCGGDFLYLLEEGRSFWCCIYDFKSFYRDGWFTRVKRSILFPDDPISFVSFCYAAIR